MTQTIEIPEGFELKKVSDTEYRIVKKENVLPKTWEEFCESYPIKEGEYFIGNTGDILEINSKNRRNSCSDKNILPSKEKAEAIFALCQLIQLRDCYNDGWKPGWEEDSNKYVIYFIEGEPTKNLNIACERILAFKSSELRDEFLNNFKDLIKKLKPLYE